MGKPKARRVVKSRDELIKREVAKDMEDGDYASGLKRIPYTFKVGGKARKVTGQSNGIKNVNKKKQDREAAVESAPGAVLLAIEGPKSPEPLQPVVAVAVASLEITPADKSLQVAVDWRNALGRTGNLTPLSLNNYVIPFPEASTRGDPRPWNVDPAELPEHAAPKIQSYVATVKMGCTLDLARIAMGAHNLHYNPDSFVPLKMYNFKDPYAVALVFSSGSVVINGTTCEKDCVDAMNIFTERIRSSGFPQARPVMRVRNIVATANFGFEIRIMELSACERLKGIVYASAGESVSGLTMCLSRPNCKVILFRTGRALITGLRHPREADEAVRVVWPFVRMYAK